MPGWGSWIVAAALLAPQVDAPGFDDFRREIEPLFAIKTPGHARCVACHQHRAQFHLESLSRETGSWTEAQSRRNYASALRLVVPGEPLESRLLLMPLAEEAGGTPFHPGGKHWQSQDDPRWRKLADWVRRLPVAERGAADAGFERFRERVEPIFLRARPGHARCVSCHRHRAQMHLQSPPEGRAAWDEEASRRNYAAVKRLVIPGDPEKSRLLLMPLVEEAGGTPFHPGGKFWESKADPEWQALAEWVRSLR